MLYLGFRNVVICTFSVFFMAFVLSCGSENQETTEKIDLLIYGGTIVTMNETEDLVENGAIAVHEGKIIAIGTSDSLRKQFHAQENIDAQQGLIIPGLINTHTHVPMTLFRGLADDLSLQTWLEQYIFPAEANFVTDSFVRVGTKLGIAEMIKGGTTTYCDMYYFEDAIAEVTAEAGMRGVLAQTILDFKVPDAPNPEIGIAQAEQFIRRWQGHPLIVPALGPHAPYTIHTNNLKKIHTLSLETKAPVVMHVSETKKEVVDIEKQYGLSPVKYLDKENLLNNQWILAHMVHPQAGELEIIKERGCGIAHCPESNMKLASGVAPLVSMLQLEIPVGLGTDGAASNNDLNLWEEMNAAAKIHKVVAANPELVSAKEAFKMATILGAKALHLEDKIGSLEAGKYADIVILQPRDFHRIPSYNVYSELVYTTKASDVRTVIIHGKTVMKDKRLLTLDEKKIVSEAMYYQQKIKEAP